MLLPNLIPLIDVTFSTPTPGYVNRHVESPRPSLSETLCAHVDAPQTDLGHVSLYFIFKPNWHLMCSPPVGKAFMKVLALFVLLLPVTLFAQSRYSEKNYGLSLQYPSNYKLKEGELGDEDTLGYLGPIPMEFVATGGVRVVTVEVPPDSYPGTDFNTAFVTLSVNRYLTRDECERSSDDSPEPRKPIAKKISGMKFVGFGAGDVGLGHQFGGIYYHAMANGTCYELGEGLATSGYGSVEGMKQVDGLRVFTILDTILRSIAIHAPKATAVSPSIQSLAFSPLSQRSPNTYRISWDVKGAAVNQVWFSASSPHEVSILESSQNAPGQTMFPSDTLRPVASDLGSLDLEFRNLTGGDIKETIRLFAAGTPSVSRELIIDLPPLPVVMTIFGNFVYMFPFDDAPVKVTAGKGVQLSGIQFLPRQTLWIGSTSVPIDSTDSRNITFTVPDSLPLGEYPLSVVNERGRSNVVTVWVVK